MDRREALKHTVVILGYTVAIPVLTNILESCNSAAGDWSPVVFNKTQAKLMKELAATILPKTVIPGADELHIDRFADQLIGNVFSDEDKKSFLEGMNTFDEKCQTANGKKFADCNAEERNKILSQAEAESAKIPGSIWGFPTSGEVVEIPFYRKAKQLILLGYFTSQEIGKNVLLYNPVPGQYKADIPVSEAGKIAFE